MLGAGLIGRRTRAGGAPLTFDLLKPRGPRPGGFVGPVLRFFTFVTSRDFFAFGFMVLIIAGVAWSALCVFAAVATGWLVYVLGSLFAGRRRSGEDMEYSNTA
jgi:CDP-L-myo-inositol myo-inositolphosphotransferase